MRIETTQSRKNSNRLILACIDVGSEYPNPESAPVTSKRLLKSPLTIREKFKNLAELKQSKKEISQDKDLTRNLIKKSKQYLNSNFSHTEVLLTKLKNSKLKKDVFQPKMTSRPKRIMVVPKTIDLIET
jgi:hypothetical protein